jgi:ABC-type bacteriocin/lantibiotic exporter with double-glycine peptidase domain
VVVAAELENFVMMFAVAITPFNPSQKILKNHLHKRMVKKKTTHTHTQESFQVISTEHHEKKERRNESERVIQ